MISRRVGTLLQGFDRFRTIFAHSYRDGKGSENIYTPLQGIGGVPTSPSRSKHEEGEVEVDVRVDVMAELSGLVQV